MLGKLVFRKRVGSKPANLWSSGRFSSFWRLIPPLVKSYGNVVCILFIQKTCFLKHSQAISTIDKNSCNDSSAHTKSIKSMQFHVIYRWPLWMSLSECNLSNQVEIISKKSINKKQLLINQCSCYFVVIETHFFKHFFNKYEFR